VLQTTWQVYLNLSIYRSLPDCRAAVKPSTTSGTQIHKSGLSRRNMSVEQHYYQVLQSSSRNECVSSMSCVSAESHQCCSAVRSTVSAALRAIRRSIPCSIRSAAVYCGELYCVVVSRSGVNRSFSLRAFRFIKERIFAKHKISH